MKFLLFAVPILFFSCSQKEKSSSQKETEQKKTHMVKLNLFNEKVELMLEENADMKYAEKCTQFSNQLSDEIIIDLCKATTALYNQILTEQSAPNVEYKNPKDILKKIEPSLLIIPEPRNNNEPVFHMELSLEATSIEWLVRKDQILYVGEYVGETEWEEPESYKENLYNYIRYID